MSSPWPVSGHGLKHTGRNCNARLDCSYVLDWAAEVPDEGFGGIALTSDATGDIILGGVDSVIFAFRADGAPFDAPIDVAAWAVDHGVTDPLDPTTLVYAIETTPVVTEAGTAYWMTQSGHVIKVRIGAARLVIESITRPRDGDALYEGTFWKGSPIVDCSGALYVPTSSAMAGGFGGLMKLDSEGDLVWAADLAGDGSPGLSDTGDIVAVSCRRAATVRASDGLVLKSTFNPFPRTNPDWLSLDGHIRSAYEAKPGTQMIDGVTIVTGTLHGSAVIDPVDGAIFLTMTESTQGLVALESDLALRWVADPDARIPRYYHPCDPAINPEYGECGCHPFGLPSWSSTASAAVGIDRVYLVFGVFVGHLDYWFGAFAKDDGRVLWKTRLGRSAFDSVRSQPAVDFNGNVAIVVHVSDDSGNDLSKLMIFDPDGALFFEHDIEGQTFDGPIIGRNGTIYVRTDSLYAFAPMCE